MSRGNTCITTDHCGFVGMCGLKETMLKSPHFFVFCFRRNWLNIWKVSWHYFCKHFWMNSFKVTRFIAQFLVEMASFMPSGCSVLSLWIITSICNQALAPVGKYSQMVPLDIPIVFISACLNSWMWNHLEVRRRKETLRIFHYTILERSLFKVWP